MKASISRFQWNFVEIPVPQTHNLFVSEIVFPSVRRKSWVAHVRESAKILEQNGVKYVDRINNVTDTVARQNHVRVGRG